MAVHEIDLGKVQGASHAYNLLDNSMFEVAQAGYGGSHGSGADQRYAADRWFNKFDFGTFAAANPGITATWKDNHAWMVQKLENHTLYDGKPMTLAVMTDEFGLIVGNFTYDANASDTAYDEIFHDTVHFRAYSDAVAIITRQNSVTYRWAALYEGSYTTETLPAYIPKGYAAELAECQRYYISFKPIANATPWLPVFAIYGGGLQLIAPGNMRTVPSVASASGVEVFGDGGIWQAITISDIRCFQTMQIVLFNYTADVSVTPGKAYLIRGLDALSADL